MPELANKCIPALVVKDSRAALAFYEKALGATDAQIMEGKDGSVMHARFIVEGTTMFINDDMPMMPRHPSDGIQSVGFYLYVDDCAASFKRAVDAGMISHYEPTDMFWGDRTAVVSDPYGFVWTFSQHVRDMGEEEMNKARESQGF